MYHYEPTLEQLIITARDQRANREHAEEQRLLETQRVKMAGFQTSLKLLLPTVFPLLPEPQLLWLNIEPAMQFGFGGQEFIINQGDGAWLAIHQVQAPHMSRTFARSWRDENAEECFLERLAELLDNIANWQANEPPPPPLPDYEAIATDLYHAAWLFYHLAEPHSDTAEAAAYCLVTTLQRAWEEMRTQVDELPSMDQAPTDADLATLEAYQC